MKQGTWLAVGAYVVWGLFPLYWKRIDQIPATQLIGHRIVWSFLMLVLILLVARRPRRLGPGGLGRNVLFSYVLSAFFITVNWFVYVWAVNGGFVIETSLGYFINPLVNVVFGVAFLHERLRPLQWVAIGLATAGVVYLTVMHGSLPWVALVLAFSFGSYGLLKKVAPLGSVDGLTLETGLLLLPALVYLGYAERVGEGAFLHTDAVSNALLVGAGPVTTLPLLLFASAARRIPLSMMGVLQYIAPTLQFLLGVLLYREPFARTQLIGFALVWAALVVFGVEGWAARAIAPTVPDRA